MFDYKKTDDNPVWFLWFLMLGPGILVFLVDQLGFVAVLGVCSVVGVFSELLNLWVVDMKYKVEKPDKN
jgi:lipid-A-disaccharide synthase-like uncharacterized protein